ILYSIRLYYTTFFQMKLKYKYIVILDFFVVFGYFIGLLSLNIIKVWPIVLIVGEIFGLIYIYFNKYTNYEKPSLSAEFKGMSGEYFYLVLSSTISTSLNYLDRFLIPVLIGLNALSIYY